MNLKIDEIISTLNFSKSKSEKSQVSVIELLQKNNIDLPRKIIQKGIREGSCQINRKPIYDDIISVSEYDLIEFLGNRIYLPKKTEHKIDLLVEQILTGIIEKKLNFEEFSNFEKTKFIAFFIECFVSLEFTYDIIQTSKYETEINYILKWFYKENKIDKRVPDENDLINQIIEKRDSLISDFSKIYNNLIQSLYNKDYNDLFSEFRKIVENTYFNSFAEPIIGVNLDYFKLLHKIVSLYKEVEKEQSKESRYIKHIENNEKFINATKDLTQKDSFSTILFNILKYFNEKSHELVGGSKDDFPELFLIPDNRTYNFKNEIITISCLLKNIGKGVAKKIYLDEKNSNNIRISKQLICEIIAPETQQKINFKISNTNHLAQELIDLKFNFKISWEDFNDNQSEKEITDFRIIKQNDNLPWEEVKATNPYDIRKIEDSSKLFGRDKLIDNFKFGIDKSSVLNSCIIHGLKRVGKSSIVKTLESFYSSNINVHFIYTEITDRRGENAADTFNNLGKFLAKQLVRDFEKKNPEKVDKLQIPLFNCSFSPLIDLIDEICELNKFAKIIFALDEFDELNDEFFMNSEIGNTFASNIGKGLVNRKNVGVILIGSENTENKIRQRSRFLNTMKFVPVDTFSKTDFDEYCKIIKNPTKECLNFAPEVLEKLFDYTNGNPYYTNRVCSDLFELAFEKRISYIDYKFLEDVLNEINNKLATNEFVHFWQDGAIEDTTTNKKIFSKRCRILIAFAETKRSGTETTWDNIKKKLNKYPSEIILTENDFEESFNEFIHRKIFYKENNVIEIKPKIFEQWLIGNGFHQVISQLDDKEGIKENIQEDEKFKLTEDQIKTLSNHLFGEEQLNKHKQLFNFFEQFENNREKSIIAEFFKEMKVVKSSDLITFLKISYKKIWPEIILNNSDLNIRKDAEIISLKDSFKQNEILYETFIKKQFYLSSNKKIKTIDSLNNIEENITNIIIFEPLIDCEFYYKNEIAKIFKNINPNLSNKIKIHILSFVISVEAKEELQNLFNMFSYFKVSIYFHSEFERKEISPYMNKLDGINDFVFKIMTKIHGFIYEESCLVKIGETIPLQCFPLLWSSTEKFKPLFESTNTKELYKSRLNKSLKIKDYVTLSESKKIELKASLNTPERNWKKINGLIIQLSKSNSDDDKYKIVNEIESEWNLKNVSNEIKNILSYTIAKNLSAFSNTNGGEIIIGIEDDGTIVGVKKNIDDFNSDFSNLVKNYIGNSYMDLFSTEEIIFSEDEKVFKIIVSQSKTEVFVLRDEKGIQKNDQDIFIRTEHGALPLSKKEYLDWHNNKF